MKIDYINGLKSDKIFGRSKYQQEIVKRIHGVELNIIEYIPLANIIKEKFDIKPVKQDKIDDNSIKPSSSGNLTSTLLNSLKTLMDKVDIYRYNRIIKNQMSKGNIKHITSQELAYTLKFLKNHRTVVTCYDLIPWVFDNDKSFIWKENMKWMSYADCIITISNFSKAELIKYLDYPEEKIEIVYPAVDHSIYYPKRSKDILEKYGISKDEKVIIYVGSETPRQNVPVIIEAFSKLKERIPEVRLIKVGESQSADARVKIINLINSLKLQDDVIFLEYVPEEDMPKLYNASDLLVYPCEYAGFGLPPLEAMSCGTPVITSDTSSLPEVVGDAGIMIEPKDDTLMAEKMYEVLTSVDLRNEMIKKGLKRAEMFKWQEAADKTLNIYKDLSN